jgi:hypothetical protein
MGVVARLEEFVALILERLGLLRICLHRAGRLRSVGRRSGNGFVGDAVGRRIGSVCHRHRDRALRGRRVRRPLRLLRLLLLLLLLRLLLLLLLLLLLALLRGRRGGGVASVDGLLVSLH